jgi:hypothetical protein
MKTIKLLFLTLITALTITSCSNSNEPIYYPPTLEEILTGYDLWYVDYDRTTGPGNIPFLSMAFTISFRNGRLYANNNIVGIGFTGNGYGIEIGSYDTYNGFLEVDHIIDGYYDFDVVELSSTSIKLVNNRERVTYYLEGYQKRDFDFDKIFYDNIEYFLQEYDGWEKTYVSPEGEPNEFDYENFLYFSQENVIQIFGSSIDDPGTEIGNVFWDYEGVYEVFNVTGYDDLKILTLDYDINLTEEFELSVVNDEVISLYHYASGTTYEFTGRGFIQYLKPNDKLNKTDDVRIIGRERTKVERKTKVRKNKK